MCFSATASFVTAAALAPVAAVSVTLARRRDPSRWLPLALTPLLFAVQQAIEGGVWLGLTGGSPGAAALMPLTALAYLGFAFALWPVWMPWSALRLLDVERRASGDQRRALMRLLWALGCLLAALLWLPLLLDPALIRPVVQHGSINYRVLPAWAASVGHQPIALLYALIICVPLAIHPCRRLRWLAVALAVAFAVAQLAFLYAFSSVWCYFSAVLSALVVWILMGDDVRSARVRLSPGLAEPQRAAAQDGTG